MFRDLDRYDFFVSYARTDDENGFIKTFVDGIVEEQRRLGRRELSYFLDRETVQGFDDWQRRIREALVVSRLFVAFVSPAYFASDWCRREWQAWIDTEIEKHILSSGSAAIYVVDVPGLREGSRTEAEVASAIVEMLGAARPAAIVRRSSGR